MDPTAIIFPAIAMFFVSFSLTVYMAHLRVSAVRSGEISIRYYRHFNEGEQPKRLHVVGRHVQNQFEVPPLFHIALLFLYVTGSVTAFSVGLAWLYVGLRCVHTFIHLGRNDVRHRVVVWGTSGMVLAALWATLLASLVSQGA